MNQKTTETEERPAEGTTVYRIAVKERLDPAWESRLGSMRIIRHESSIHTGTTLIGPIRDRAELTGILNTLSSLQLTLLKVEAVEGTERSEITQPWIGER